MDADWQIRNTQSEEQVLRFAEELNSSPILARVLLHRGVEDVETARRYFRPSLSHLHDPFAMAGMNDAVQRVLLALEKRQRILIYGDYDVDGTTATSMLLLFLRQLGHPADFYIPERLVEGYGLSERGIKYARDNGFELIISVDCGITAEREIATANRLGMDVIVCDHHQPGNELPPALAVLNPKREDCSYPFKELAGVGVAFKLLQALRARLNLPEEKLLELLDLVAVGSAADIVPLVDENRVLVKFGLDRLRQTGNVGLRALLEATALWGKNVGTGQVVFVLAPRINAVGRLGDAGRAVRMLTTDNEQQARNIASILESENRNRRDIDEATLAEAVECIETQFVPEKESVFVLSSEGWHPGVIGIVASRLVEKYYRPTVMIATENGQGRGSARSIPGFDIYQALKHCEELMVNFGGHKYAAGLTIESDNIPQLREKLAEVASNTLSPEMLKPKLWIDAQIRLSEIDEPLLKLLRRMAPYGPQNMRPVFMSGGLQIVGTPTVVGKNHLRFKVRQDGVVMDAIGFNLAELKYRISSGEKNVEMVYVIDENEWQGRKRIQLRVKDLR
ncbi:MAG: single-stranded-DNA-specific exonuclease RecJ [Calditrichaeota bacterium]|nr:MAG: single-stranded-DNA-specific exonuclease RecJ [Calditrichota bacterium]